MAVFKRVKLFMNITEFDSNNMMFEQVWGYKIKATDGVDKVGRYRIRYSKSDQSYMFQDGGLSEADMAAFEEAMGAHGPAISCEVSQWSEKGWTKCLDWLGDPDSLPRDVCDEVNDQYRSFITGKPMGITFYKNPIVPPAASPNEPVDKKTVAQPVVPDLPEDDSDSDGNFDWI
jgi:hypothetical protein